jgi:ABC-2 type transport system ATP-binding protein
MPENNPLYGEMRVREYLAYRAELKGVARRKRRQRVAEAIERCGTGEVADRIVGTLSKGYRQRVGLADAMVGDPDVLILDEPTIGLDPNQVREARHLIAELGQDRTVLLSTHILAEAEALCRRVLIIDAGRIVADDSPHSLADETLRTEVIVEARGELDRMRERFLATRGVEHLHVDSGAEWHRFRLATRRDVDVREEVFRSAAECGWVIRELTRSRVSLEDVFHRLTIGDGTDQPRSRESVEGS